jgi:hypothetical protein
LCWNRAFVEDNPSAYNLMAKFEGALALQLARP